MLEPSSSSLDRARHLIRALHEATLLYDQTPMETRFMVDPRSGDLIVAIEDDALAADDIVLACPRDAFDTPIRISITLSDTVDEEQRDRYTTYLLPPTPPLLAIGSVSFVKLDSGEVFEPEELALANPLVGDLGALCRRLNADRAALAALCRTLAGADFEDPLAVGVDDRGIDVRASHGVARLELPAPVADTDEAQRVLDALLESAGA